MADELLLLVGAGAGADLRGSLTGGSLNGALLAGLGCGVGMAAGFVFGVDLAGLEHQYAEHAKINTNTQSMQR